MKYRLTKMQIQMLIDGKDLKCGKRVIAPNRELMVALKAYVSIGYPFPIFAQDTEHGWKLIPGDGEA